MFQLWGLRKYFLLNFENDRDDLWQREVVSPHI